MQVQIKRRDNLKLSNTFIEAKCDKMSKDEQNFLYLCISQINADDKDFSMMKIHLSELEQLALVKKNYAQVREFIARLSRKGVNIQNGKTFMPRVFFQKLNYIEGTGYIQAKLHEDLFDLCLELKANFTQASLMSCMSFSSKYSTPLYLLLKAVYDKRNQYEDYIFIDYDIEFMQKHFHLPKSYSLYNRMKEKFLEVTEKDINDNSDFDIMFEPVKMGRKLEAIRFVINKKPKNKTIDIQDFSLDFDTTDIETKVLSKLDSVSKETIKRYGFDIAKIEKLIEYFGINRVTDGLYVMSKRETNAHTNPFGYMKAIIEDKSKKQGKG